MGNRPIDRGAGGGGVAAGVAGGLARRQGLRLHAAEPGPLSVAVVLGLLLRRDLLAALRAGARPQGARDPARGAATRRLHRPHDLLGPPGHARPLPLLQRRLAARVPDRDDPAAAARLGLADRRRRPGGGAADRRPGRVADAQPRSRRRRAAVARATGRVGPRRLAQVRPGLGVACRRPARLSPAGRGQPAARLRRAPGPRRGRPGALRGPDQHLLVALAAGAGPPLGDAGAGRPAVGRAPRPLPRRGAAGRRAARHRDRRGAGAARPARPAGGDRPAPGRAAPAERAPVPHPGRAPLGRRRRAELRAGRRPWPDPPLLARPHLGQHRLALLARPAPPRLPRGGRADGQRPDRRRGARRPARVLRPENRKRDGRKATSPGPHW